jgi:hypothetical protein
MRTRSDGAPFKPGNSIDLQVEMSSVNPKGKTLPVDDRLESAVDSNRPWFETTCWQMVLRAKEHFTPDAERALEQLCRAYWHPL